MQYINLLVLVLTLGFDIRDRFPENNFSILLLAFKRNLFVFPAEFVPFNIPCIYCFLVGLF